MKLAFAFLAGLAVAASAVRTPQPEATTTPPIDPAKVEPYVLKNKSAFKLADDARPPFWPIGMKKKADPMVAKAGPVVKPKKDPVLKAEYFTVTGVLLGKPPLATLNGHSYSQGEMVPVIFEGRRIDLSVRAVLDGGVQLAQGDNIFFVPLHRQEFTPGGAAPVQEPTNAQSRVLDLDATVKKTK